MKQNLGIVRDYEINQVYSMWVQPHERCFSSWTSWRRIAWRHCTRLVLSCMSFVITPYLNFFLVKVDLSQERTINSSSSKKIHSYFTKYPALEGCENKQKITWSKQCDLESLLHCKERPITLEKSKSQWSYFLLLEK